MIAAYSAPFVSSASAIADAAVTAITDMAVDHGLGGAFADTTALRTEVGDLVAHYLREWLIEQIIDYSAIEGGHTDDEAS